MYLTDMLKMNGLIKKNYQFHIKNNFENLKRNGKKILGYAGGHAKSNALDYLLDAMKLIEIKDVICVMLEKGKKKKD